MESKLPARPLAVLMLLALALVGVGPCPPSKPPVRKGRIHTNVWTTSFGIPHIHATSWAGMGYGLGYADARDNLCIRSPEIVTSRG